MGVMFSRYRATYFTTLLLLPLAGYWYRRSVWAAGVGLSLPLSAVGFGMYLGYLLWRCGLGGARA